MRGLFSQGQWFSCSGPQPRGSSLHFQGEGAVTQFLLSCHFYVPKGDCMWGKTHTSVTACLQWDSACDACLCVCFYFLS